MIIKDRALNTASGTLQYNGLVRCFISDHSEIPPNMPALIKHTSNKAINIHSVEVAISKDQEPNV